MNVVIYPAEILRQKANPVEEINDTVCQNAHEMLDLMYEAEGVGLAAPQVGLSQRLIVVDVNGELKDDERIFINPFIINEEGFLMSEEGCLSFPGVTGKIPRSDTVEVVGYSLKGERIQIKADGLLSRVFQHEIDHLNGILFIDKMTPASSLDNVQKIKEFERSYEKVRAY